MLLLNDFLFLHFLPAFAWAWLDHFISSLSFYEGPKAQKIVQWFGTVKLPILYIMFQPSELTTATKVFVHFNMGFSAGQLWFSA